MRTYGTKKHSKAAKPHGDGCAVCAPPVKNGRAKARRAGAAEATAQAGEVEGWRRMDRSVVGLLLAYLDGVTVADLVGWLGACVADANVDEGKGYDGTEWALTDGFYCYSIYARHGALRVGGMDVQGLNSLAAAIYAATGKTARLTLACC